MFARRRPLKGVFRRDMWLTLLLMGLLDGGSLLAYFFAIRSIGVAVATFLLFVQPVWVALLARGSSSRPRSGSSSSRSPSLS